MFESRAQSKAVLAAAAHEPLKFVCFVHSTRVSAHDMWRRGGVMFVVPSLFSRAHISVMRAFVARRVANFTQRCPLCDEVGEVGQAFRHQADCAATDEAIIELMRRFPLDPAQPGERLIEIDPLTRGSVRVFVGGETGDVYELRAIGGLVRKQP